MGSNGWNAGGFAYMPVVTCPECGARRKLGRESAQDPWLCRCPDREKCNSRKAKGHLLYRIKNEAKKGPTHVPQQDRQDYWPCACTKGRESTLRIKLNHKSIRRCRTCKAERPDDSWFEQDEPPKEATS